MTKQFRASTLSMVALATLVAAGPSAAQYKVVAADGSITYTDRPPTSASVRVTPLRRSGQPEADTGQSVALPIELRQIVARYPVMLYTTTECAPCEAGRKLLQQRGVPYVEKLVASEEDALALERLVGWRTVPSVTVGTQALRGYAAAEWGAYIDAAGYPRDSRLPRGWAAPAATTLTERARVAAAPEQAAPAQAPTSSNDINPAPGAIRF